MTVVRRMDWAVQLEATAARRQRAQEVSRQQGKNIQWHGFCLLQFVMINLPLIINPPIYATCPILSEGHRRCQNGRGGTSSSMASAYCI